MQIRPGGLDDAQVEALLRLHRDESAGSTPRENAHALDLDGLRAADVSFWTAWDGDTLLGMAANVPLRRGVIDGDLEQGS